MLDGIYQYVSVLTISEHDMPDPEDLFKIDETCSVAAAGSSINFVLYFHGMPASH
jgi:hypothetical protein